MYIYFLSKPESTNFGEIASLEDTIFPDDDADEPLIDEEEAYYIEFIAKIMEDLVAQNLSSDRYFFLLSLLPYECVETIR